MRTTASFVLAGLCLGCSPMTHGGDVPGADLAPLSLDLAAQACQAPPGNLLADPGFEAAPGSANNTGKPPSTIPSWDGCCNGNGQGQTTTWQAGAATMALPAHCGQGVLQITSALAQDDVLSQDLTVAGGSGAGYVLAGWAQLRAVSAGPGTLRLDVFDLDKGAILLASDPLDGRTAQPGAWVRLAIAGDLPATPAPRVQVRLRTTGTLSALADDISFTLR